MSRASRMATNVVVMALFGWCPLLGATESSIAPGSPAWVVESAEYTGEVKEQIARIEARYTIRVIREGWTEVPLQLDGATVTSIEIRSKAGEAHVVARNGSYVLAASKKGAYTVEVKFAALLTQDSQSEGVQFSIPTATFSTVSLFVPRKDVELRPQDQLYVERKPDGLREGVTLVARVGAADRIDLRWKTRPAAPVHVEPVLYAETSHLVILEEQLARLTTMAAYRIAQGETKEFRLRLPSAINVLNVRGAGIEDWKVTEIDGHKTLTVTLGGALKETTYQLIVEGEETITEAATEYTLPEIELVGVKQERGYLAIARTGNIEIAPRTTEGMNRVDVRELPDVLRTGTSAPAVLAFRYHQHPYRGMLALTRHEDHAVLAAVAERGELVTVLSRQGQLLTRATYLVKANKKQFLGVTLPEGATLWSCIVDGRSVKPVKGDGDVLLVPLDTTSDSARAVAVELVYFEQRPELSRLGQLRLHGPRLDVPTTVANWSLFAPKQVKFFKFSGNLDRGVAAGGFVEEPFVLAAMSAPLSNQAGYEYKDERLKEGGNKQTQEKLPRTIRALEHNNKAVLLEKAQSGDAYGRSESSSVKRLVARDRQTGGSGDDASGSDDGLVDQVIKGLGQLQERGILPLKIQLPKAGTVHRFSRLMTVQEALELDATFVRLPEPWVPLTAIGLFLFPVGGVVVTRLRRG